MPGCQSSLPWESCRIYVLFVPRKDRDKRELKGFFLKLMTLRREILQNLKHAGIQQPGLTEIVVYRGTGITAFYGHEDTYLVSVISLPEEGSRVRNVIEHVGQWILSAFDQDEVWISGSNISLLRIKG